MRARFRGARIPADLEPISPRHFRWSYPLSNAAPSPPGALPVLGHIKTALLSPTELLAEFERLAYRHGPIVRLQFGALTFHLISSPELVQEVLSHRKRFNKEFRSAYSIRLVAGTGLLTNQGDSWLSQRRIAQPVFGRARIDGFARSMDEIARASVESWRPGVRDLHADLMELTLQVIAQTMLSIDVGQVAHRLRDAITFVLAEVDRRLNAVVQVPLSIPTPQNRRLEAAVLALDDVVFDAIEARRKQPPKDDLLGAWMAARDADTGAKMTDEQLRDEVMTVFLAGHETTANLLSWTMHLLARHPETQAQVVSELEEARGRGLTPANQTQQMPFMEQVLKESMRLFPPAYVMARSPITDETLGGYHIPARSVVVISPWLMHRHRDHWEQPARFDPSRFEGKDPSRFLYLPFGAGPRICIGNHFAMMEAKLVLSAILSRFRIEALSDEPPELLPQVTLRPKGGMKLRLVERPG
ncbi:MAG: cytochrome P450 [Polyangiales bacterium]